MLNQQGISKATLRRLPMYLRLLKSLPESAPPNISASSVASALGLNEVQVRKDLAIISSGGKPKIGFSVKELVIAMEEALGYNDVNDAVIVGAGKLGQALMHYEGFKEYGLNIVAAFDTEESVISEENKIYPISRLPDLCGRMNIHIGIITVPEAHAQEVCDMLIKTGVMAIWNFAPVNLSVPPDILVQNENMAMSLAILSNHLKEKVYNH